jgi:hypothetical protein
MERRLTIAHPHREARSMKTNPARSTLAALFGFGMSLGGPAIGQELPDLRAAAQFSITQGFKQSSLPLLRRLGGDAPDAVTAALVEKLCAGPCPSLIRRAPGNLLEVTNGNWSLQVLGDGAAARFRDVEVGKRAHSLAREDAQKTSAESLVRAAHDYISANLASVIVLGPEERLVPLRTDYRIEAGQDLKIQKVTRSVVANRVVFGRTIRDIPIVGGGSKVVLTFANDGSLESFQYDWPKYETGSARPVVNLAGIVERMQRVVGLRMGVPASMFSAREPKGQGPGYGIELIKGAVLQRLECGLYDPGFAARDTSAPVQPGCVYNVVSQGDAGGRVGLTGAVPGAVRIEPDARWPESVMLRDAGAGEPVVPGPSRAQ